MYSLMLMAAVAGGPDASGFGWRTGCTGCYGSCYGSSCYGSSCTGSCYGSSCYGSSCTGSCYGSCHGSCHGGLFSRLADWCQSRSSCHGSCYGSSCHGSCYGSCYGSGYRSGCWGSCYGSSCHGTWYTPATYGCTGCTGCGGYIVGPVTVPGVPPTAPAPGAMPPAGGTGTPAAPPAKSGSIAAPASLTVDLPASGAKLYVDGVLAAGDGLSRKFHTPELPADQAFFYDLKAEVVVNGKVQTEETRVIVRAGDAVSATFPKLTAALAADRTLASK